MKKINQNLNDENAPSISYLVIQHRYDILDKYYGNFDL
jgi:hypothetical protein